MQETPVRFLGRDDTIGEGNGNPHQYSCLGKPVNKGAWQTAIHDATEQLNNNNNKCSYCHHNILDVP